MKIKFCGIVRCEDLDRCLELGVDFVGFVFFPKSKRFVPYDKFLDLISGKVFEYTKRVGVFVNEDREKVFEFSRNLDFVQLHGDETPEYVEWLEGRGIRTIKAFRVRDESVVNEIRMFVSEFVLIDTFVEGQYGGTGKRIDLKLIDYILSKVDRKVIISGGITPENLPEILGVVYDRAYGIDVSSGIEISPGVKDGEKMDKIVSIVRASLFSHPPRG